MKYLKLYFIGLILINSIITMGQVPAQYAGYCSSCEGETDLIEETTCGNTSPLWSSNTLWIPENNHEVKYVKVNMIFLHKNDGTGNFVFGNQEHDELLADLFARVNRDYSHLFNPEDPNCHVNEGFLADSKVQFVPNIVHINNSTYWNNEGQDLCPNNWHGTWLDVLDNVIVHDPSIPRGINVYFTETESYYNSLVINHTTQSGPPINAGCSQFPSKVNMDFSSKVHMPDVYSKYYWMKNIVPGLEGEPWDPIIRSWFICSIGDLLAHELGHSLSLEHIFYCHHNLMYTYPGGGGYDNSLSPNQIGSIHRHLSISSIRKYTTTESYVSDPYYITGNTIWDLNFTSYRDVIIEPNACLTVTCKLVMKSNARIIVKPGGKLVVDGGIITTEDDVLWPGIEVWGNRNTHQYAVNGSYGQGYVELKNGATIENAVCALNLWQPDHWSNTGGIVHAADAVFRNNHRSVHALYYKNYHPTNLRETDYNATFRRCQFVVNENYLGDEDHVFHKHVDLSHVRGFKFYACDFSVTAPSNNISYWTSGIAGNEAGFLVNGICDSYQIPCSNYDQSTFTGFFTAINSVSDGSKSAPAITVRHSSFDNNDFGIYMRKLSNASILFSDFDVKRQDNWLCGAGIFSENMFNFTIEENEFKKNNTFNGNSIGVYIKNSDLKNIIYNNLFMNLYCGNLAIGKNIEGVGSEHLGLEYLCNTNIGNNIDFYVSKEPNVYSGIQINQGSALAAARNTFSENGYHFYNGGDFIVSYYYYNVPGFENERPLYFNSDKFFPIPTDQTSGCPSHYSGTAVDTVVISPERRQQLEQEYYEAYNTYHSLKTIYEQHVDGGNTQNELNDITTATPSDMWALRAQLLNHSPFLSGKVLETSADHPNVLPEPVLFEILISNPDELKKDSLMNYLENKDNPLPQDKINMLRQIANGTTAKTVMQTQMAASKRDFSRAAGEIIRSLVNDTIFNVAEYREWLTNMEDINADQEIIATYVDEGDFTTALALADMLPSLYGLTGTDLAEHQDYKDLLMLYRDWYNDGRNAMQMNNTERAIVEHIADYSTGIPQMMARTLLEESTGESDAENSFACVTLTLPEGGQGRGCTFTSEDIGKAMGMDVSVKPNPATTWTAVDYTLPAKMAQATIRVTNALGVTVMTAELNGNQGQKVLDLRNLADGVYVYTISCGEYVQTGKLVIAK